MLEVFGKVIEVFWMFATLFLIYQIAWNGIEDDDLLGNKEEK